MAGWQTLGYIQCARCSVVTEPMKEMVSVSAVDSPLVIAIDGPSGSGKSSTARGVATRLGLRYLDTGAMYRAAAWLVLNRRIDPVDHGAVLEALSEHIIDISTDPAAQRVVVGGEDVTEAIREPMISSEVSAVATIPKVREHLVALQRRAVVQARPGIVVEGRDITTVVAPDAQVRVLLVADPAARVARREAELGGRADTAEVTDQVIRRDRDDSTVAKFTEAAPGVTVVDSTHLTLEQVIDEICSLAPPSAEPAAQ